MGEGREVEVGEQVAEAAEVPGPLGQVVLGLSTSAIDTELAAFDSRFQALIASTQNQMNQIVGAIERYKTDTGAYPGPLPNTAFTSVL